MSATRDVAESRHRRLRIERERRSVATTSAASDRVLHAASPVRP